LIVTVQKQGKPNYIVCMWDLALHVTVFDSTPLNSRSQYSKATNKKAVKILRESIERPWLRGVESNTAGLDPGILKKGGVRRILHP